jgi:hypothetical protein
MKRWWERHTHCWLRHVHRWKLSLTVAPGAWLLIVGPFWWDVTRRQK